MAAEDELIRLKMPVEDALQLIISMGAVRPEVAAQTVAAIDAARPER